ncbi:MAG: hypothetical protein FJX80_05075 [Bacteroidetes bacterium]|nr:hypothetical protein [Bacteroidota bacterium]
MKKKRNQPTIKPKQTFKLPSKFLRKTTGKSVNTRSEIVRNSICGNRELPLNRKIRTPFVYPISRLDEKTQKSVNQYLTQEKVLMSGCHTNSFLLSHNDPSIKTIHGYVGLHYTDREFRKLVNRVGDNGIRLSNGLIEHNTSDYGVQYYDVKRNMRYFRHSWNSDSSRSFDLTKELNPSFKNEWWNYYPTESIDLRKDLTTQESQVSLLLGKVIQSSLIDNGLFILNKKQRR